MCACAQTGTSSSKHVFIPERTILLVFLELRLGLVMRKPDLSICENKDADQLRGNREADQRLCFRNTDSTTPLLPKSKISSLWPFSVVVQPGLCGTWSETPKTGFLRTRLASFWTILGGCLLLTPLHAVKMRTVKREQLQLSFLGF